MGENVSCLFVFRWLKFEEDVEDGGERWSKPYVATLSLHSLFELRSCILNGTVLLDMRAGTLEEIADMAIDGMLASGQLDETVREKVREAMLRRHHHQNEKKLSNRIPLVRSFADIGKKYSDPHLLDRNGETPGLLSFFASQNFYAFVGFINLKCMNHRYGSGPKINTEYSSDSCLLPKQSHNGVLIINSCLN